MTYELFLPHEGDHESLGTQACILRGYALSYVDDVLTELRTITQQAPFRNMVTPGGHTMSVALTSCGALGWTTDRRGYRYTRRDPETGQPWPALPAVFNRLAEGAALAAGFEGFRPDACLINRYLPGTRMSLHQDKNERDYQQPIVSVSLGMTATFLFGGMRRNDTPVKHLLFHGDVVVWGGEDRLRFHGIMPLKLNPHPVLASQRINLTFRKAG